MTGNDTDADDDNHGLAREVVRAREQGTVESLKMSLAGWRDTAGMNVNAAVAIDAVFLVVGAAAALQGTGMIQTAGYIIAAFGVLGFIEKVWRRV